MLTAWKRFLKATLNFPWDSQSLGVRGYVSAMVVIALVFLLAVGVWAVNAEAGNGSCNLDLVLQGVCRSSSNLVLFYDAPGSAFADLRDSILEEYNYQAEVVCASSRQFEPLLNNNPSKILTAAGQSTDSCTVGQPTPNPQGTAEFADAVIDTEPRNRVIAWKLNAAQEAAADPSTIPTPDTGQ